MSKLFVSSFPESYSEESISLIFSPFGDIRSIKIVNESRLFAIVEFRTSQESNAAMASLKGRRLYGFSEPLHIEAAFDRKRRVVVSGVSVNLPEEKLIEFFGYYGLVENIAPSDDVGTIFVDFSSQKDAERLLELDGKIIYDGDVLLIKPFVKSEKRNRVPSSERSIFIYNLSPRTTETDLSEVFVKFGKIQSVGVLNGGKGFVNYDKELSALKAIRHMDGKSVGGKKIRIVLKSMKRGLSGRLAQRN